MNYIIKLLREQFKIKDCELIKYKRRREDLKALLGENQIRINETISNMELISDTIIDLKETKE